jgi:DNA modification methylase
MDVSFTSPPYFNLEIYANDNSASTINYNNYEAWLEQFVRPTIDNTYKYLKNGGYAMINIKNLTIKGKQPLFDDWFKIFSDHGGFEFVEIFDIKLPSAKQYYQNCTYSKEEYKGFKEPVMSFRKV